jgi:hypothetical protein
MPVAAHRLLQTGFSLLVNSPLVADGSFHLNTSLPAPQQGMCPPREAVRSLHRSHSANESLSRMPFGTACPEGWTAFANRGANSR